MDDNAEPGEPDVSAEDSREWDVILTAVWIIGSARLDPKLVCDAVSSGEDP